MLRIIRVGMFLTRTDAMPAKSSLTASLTPELSAFIAAKVASGQYRSASEVVRAALRLLVEQDRRSEPKNSNRSNYHDEQGSAA